MLVPGANLLTLAHGLIGRQTVQWLRFTGMTTNAAGVDVPAWAEPVDIYGSFQAVSATMLQNLGLDWTKDYATFYNENQFSDPSRDKTGDRLIYGGDTYQIESKTPWYKQDGWESVLCVKVTNA